MHSLPAMPSDMKRICQDILYAPLWLIMHLLAFLPLRVLYLVSYLLYIIIYRVVGYRRKVVRDNLTQCFPDKSVDELRKIERKFYRFFSDYIVETLKVLHISDTEMKQRMEFVDAEVVDRFTTQGRSVMLLLGHYGNWEWIPSLTMWCACPDNIQLGQVYRTLRNEWFDRFFLRLRSRFGTRGISKEVVLRTFLQYRRDGLVSLTGFMADQTPSINNIHHWTKFLGRPTAALSGFEAIAKRLDMAVVYVDVELVKRGHYRATFRLLEDNPTACPDYDITDRYMQAMEQTIRRAPHAWLWSHKRWKHTPQTV